MDSIVDDIASDIINIVYTQYSKESNKKQIDAIFNDFSKRIITKIQVYFLILAILLIVLTLMSVVEFYYYTRMFMLYSKETSLKTIFV
jgi:hypothetical protein